MPWTDVFSAVNSSPWTAENFGGDQTKNASVREYVWHGIGLTVFYVGGAAILARSWWPIFGGGITLAYMYFLYTRALDRGAARQSQGWSAAAAAPAAATPQANGNGNSTPMPWSA